MSSVGGTPSPAKKGRKSMASAADAATAGENELKEGLLNVAEAMVDSLNGQLDTN